MGKGYNGSLLFFCCANPKRDCSDFPCYDCFEIDFYRVSDISFVIPIKEGQTVIQLFRESSSNQILVRELINNLGLPHTNNKLMPIKNVLREIVGFKNF